MTDQPSTRERTYRAFAFTGKPFEKWGPTERVTHLRDAYGFDTVVVRAGEAPAPAVPGVAVEEHPHVPSGYCWVPVDAGERGDGE